MNRVRRHVAVSISTPRRRPARAALSAALCAAALAGCGPFNTAAYRVPPELVASIETLQLPEAPAPATQEVGPTTLPASQPEAAAERALTLMDVRELALANNLDLRVSRLDPQIAAASLDAERAAFDAVFVTDASYGTTDQPTASQLEGSSTESIQLSPGLLFPLRTGGNIRLDVPMRRFETSNQFSTLNPSYDTELRGTLSQPLARGFGANANELGIRIATAQLGQALVRQKLDVIAILSNADRTYWLLYAAARAVAVEQEQYDLAVAQLERTRRLVAAEDQPQVEELRAESNVADALEGLIEARQLERERQRQLKRILNEASLDLDSPTRIVPGTLPDPRHYALDAPALEAAALTRRMELLQAELRIAEETANVLAARNQTLPQLDLQYRWNSNGLGGDFNDSLDQATTLDFQDHFVGLSFGIPLGNREARARLRASILRRLQELASREAQILLVRQEVFDAADRLETGWQQILAAQRRVELASRLYDAEVRRFDLGLATGLEVTEAQANLAAAQFAEIEAVTSYEIARVDLAVATGTVIGQGRVLLEIPDEPRR